MIGAKDWRQADFRGLIVRLEIAKGSHKVLDLARRRGFAGFEVTLNAQSGEERQHHLRNCGKSHPRLFRLDAHREEAQGQGPIAAEQLRRVF